MNVSRRGFLKLAGVATGAAAGAALKWSPAVARAAQAHKVADLHPTPTICAYCGVGCGLIMWCNEDRSAIKAITPDADHPINEGALCSKGAGLLQLEHVDGQVNSGRLQKVKYRAPNSDAWIEKDWDWAMSEIAKRIKNTRDANWIERNDKGQLVNRTESIACVGSVFINSEEAYLLSKMVRGLGIVYNENEARICVSAGVLANEITLGRGPMGIPWTNFKTSDCVFAIGCNAAETFPISFRWITEARKTRGAKLIVADPRFTRTAAQADIYLPFRSGTDVALVGGIINYILGANDGKKEYIQRKYLVNYTDAPFIIAPNDEGEFEYATEQAPVLDKNGNQKLDETGAPVFESKPKMDVALTDENCVYQTLVKHFRQFDIDSVVGITGTDRAAYLEACKTLAATCDPQKAGALIFSSGATESSHGTQNIRAYNILQLMLGNVGVSGGGINGIAGACNGLGCSLQGRLHHHLPGFFPIQVDAQQSLKEYDEAHKGAETWKLIGVLKAFFGEAATQDNDYLYDLIPKRGGNYTFVPMFNDMHAGKIKGLLSWGMNPAVSAADSNFAMEALKKLEWLVVVDPFETETAAVWKAPGVDSSKIGTEVFLLPAATSLEKEGSMTSTCRWMQWRYKGANPPGEAKSDLWILDQLTRKIKELYKGRTDKNADAINNLVWDYGEPADIHNVAREINGYLWENNKPARLLANLKELKGGAGKASCGDWLFCGSYTEEGNLAARRNSEDPFGTGLYPKWAWCFPLNRRVMYNQASLDPETFEPWNQDLPVIEKSDGKWVGDVPDGEPGASIKPFVMLEPYGRAKLFMTAGLNDGPLPSHFEPWENPIAPDKSNPTLKAWDAEPGDISKFPIVATTFRLVEHLHTGSFTRNLPGLTELMPDMFVEISHELAEEKQIKSGDMVFIESARGKIEAIAAVTSRLRLFDIKSGGVEKKVHQIAMPWHWGYMGLAKGHSANNLTPRTVDSNAFIPEYRAFMCDISKAEKA